MSSPARAFGHQNGLDSRPSLAVASSCRFGQRLTWPLTNPVAWAIWFSPLLLKSWILTSQPQPDQAVPVEPLVSSNGATPSLNCEVRSWLSFDLFMNWKFDSSMPHDVVMLLTNRS